MVHKRHTLTFETRKRLFVALSMLCTVALVVYVAGVLMTVHHTVARAALEKEVTDLTTHTSEEEFTAIAIKNTISLDTAYARGFQEVTHPVYITRADGPTLTRR